MRRARGVDQRRELGALAHPIEDPLDLDLLLEPRIDVAARRRVGAGQHRARQFLPQQRPLLPGPQVERDQPVVEAVVVGQAPGLDRVGELVDQVRQAGRHHHERPVSRVVRAAGPDQVVVACRDHHLRAHRRQRARHDRQQGAPASG
ncbi:hypothetical protein OV079_14170 [Nannocystis pusilla]|uniref:Uncharacterized protein n=1 Tax=Nannocystis pusilla TaxID=889268 RepID=A0A9X3EP43_9BACT|nr:hypothetical protein [Nannocystis pusilla]MCY1006675.1 hypothetical protein [Nannocystis pusilla]